MKPVIMWIPNQKKKIPIKVETETFVNIDINIINKIPLKQIQQHYIIIRLINVICYISRI